MVYMREAVCARHPDAPRTQAEAKASSSFSLSMLKAHVRRLRTGPFAATVQAEGFSVAKAIKYAWRTMCAPTPCTAQGD